MVTTSPAPELPLSTKPVKMPTKTMSTKKTATKKPTKTKTAAEPAPDRHAVAVLRARSILSLVRNHQLLDKLEPRISEADLEQLNPAWRFVEDLAMDLWTVNYLVESEFKVARDESRPELRTVADLIALLEQHHGLIEATYS